MWSCIFFIRNRQCAAVQQSASKSAVNLILLAGAELKAACRASVIALCGAAINTQSISLKRDSRCWGRKAQLHYAHSLPQSDHSPTTVPGPVQTVSELTCKTAPAA
jgi:hypothetical protein